MRRCETCGATLAHGSHPSRRYCSDAHRKAASRARRGPSGAETPAAGATAPPPVEGLDEVGRAAYDEAWTALPDRAASDAALCRVWADLTVRRLRLLAVLDEEGFFTTGSAGQMAPHPAARLVSDVEARLLALSDRLGLHAAARARLVRDEVDTTPTALDRFMAET
jgi:P27 family predicted phage terminase small subunit